MTIGFTCLANQYKMSIESFEAKVPYCLLNLLPANCMSVDKETLKMLQKRKDRILACVSPYGKAQSLRTHHYFFWNGKSLSGYAKFALFKSKEDAQAFLIEDFEKLIEKSCVAYLHALDTLKLNFLNPTCGKKLEDVKTSCNYLLHDYMVNLDAFC